MQNRPIQDLAESLLWCAGLVLELAPVVHMNLKAEQDNEINQLDHESGDLRFELIHEIINGGPVPNQAYQIHSYMEHQQMLTLA